MLYIFSQMYAHCIILLEAYLVLSWHYFMGVPNNLAVLPITCSRCRKCEFHEAHGHVAYAGGIPPISLGINNKYLKIPKIGENHLEFIKFCLFCNALKVLNDSY